MKLLIILISIFISVICEKELEFDFVQVLKDTDTTEVNLTPILNFSTKCFEEYGCYYNGPPFFDPVCRDISLLPADDPDKKINYMLYTPHNQFDFYTLLRTKESLDMSPYNDSAKTAIYIHGWQQHMIPTDPLFKIKDALVEKRGYNFFVIDWRYYVGDSYEEALANGRVVGSSTAKLMEFLANYTKHTTADFHLIGHSLGGQLVAYAGQETPGLGRITSLDASGPYFYTDALEVRLDPSDALFVDIIHANGGSDVFDGFGMGPPYGHQDFYPNGGQRQPDCGHEDPEIEERIKTDVLKLYLVNCCDHGRSEDYFLESIINPESNCTFRGTMCDSYENWISGRCVGNPVAVMGIDAAPIPGLPPLSKFYLDTRVKYPFCKKKGFKEPTLIIADL